MVWDDNTLSSSLSPPSKSSLPVSEQPSPLAGKYNPLDDAAPQTPTLDLFNVPGTQLFDPTLPNEGRTVAPSLDYKEYSMMLHSVVTFLREQSAKVEFVDLWFSTDLPSVVDALDAHYLQNAYSDEVNPKPPTLPPFMSSFLSPLNEIRLVMKEIKKASTKLR